MVKIFDLTLTCILCQMTLACLRCLRPVSDVSTYQTWVVGWESNNPPSWGLRIIYLTISNLWLDAAGRGHAASWRHYANNPQSSTWGIVWLSPSYWHVSEVLGVKGRGILDVRGTRYASDYWDFRDIKERPQRVWFKMAIYTLIR